MAVIKDFRIAWARAYGVKDLDTKEAAYRDFRRKTPFLWKGKDGNGTTVHQDRLFNIDAQRLVLSMRTAEIQATLAAIESALKGKNYSEILALVTRVPANKEIITPTQLTSPRTSTSSTNTMERFSARSVMTVRPWSCGSMR